MIAFVKGESALPSGIIAETGFPDEITGELDGPNAALALKMLQAIASGMKPKDFLREKYGVRLFHSLGFTLQQLYAGVAGQYSRGQWSAGRDAFKYYSGEAEPFIDEYLKTFRKTYLLPPKLETGEAKHHDANQDDGGFMLYGFIITLMVEFLKSDPGKYKKYIEPLEEFITRVCDDTFGDVKWDDWFTQREHQEAAWAACGRGFGGLSPTLKKLERRMILGNRYMDDFRLSDEEVLAWGKTLDLPEEWPEVLVLTNNYPTADGLPKYEHFKKLFKENPALFDKTLRSFYWKFDGKTNDDDVVRVSPGYFDHALILLAIKLGAGDGAAEKEELVKNWKAITAGNEAFDNENLAKLGDDSVAGPLMLYKYNLPPLDALFAKNYADCRAKKDKEKMISSIRHDLQKHLHCIAALCPGEEFDRIARPLIEKKAVSVDEIFIAPESDHPWYTVPMDVIREVAAAYPEESKAFIEKANKGEYEIDKYTAWIEAVFAPGGLPPKIALGVLNAKSKKALNSLSAVLLNHEDEVRTELEQMAPKLKKDAALIVQQLIAQWNARPAATVQPIPVVAAQTAQTAQTPATGDAAEYAATDALCLQKIDKNRQKLIAWLPADTFDNVLFADGKTPAPNVFRFIVAEHLFINIPVPLAECAELFRFLDKKTAEAALKALYELWLSAGADAKKKAVLVPYCQYNPDSTLIGMKAQIYDWIYASRGALAAFAVECLAANGGDIAFLAVDELYAKAGHKQVEKAARQSLLRAAAEAGITLDELQDRIVPNLGLDGEGSRLFDYGPRQFKAILQKDFSLSLTDIAAGKVVKSLPAPNAKDDAEKAAAAKTELSEFKKTLKEVVKSQSRRLSRVLINGRPWKPAAWRKLFVENPLMNRFASGLVWGEYDAAGKLLKTFRYMDDGSFNTAEDSPYTLPDDALISLAHPLEMGNELAVWKKQLADYEITQPIKQLDAPCAPLKDDDIDEEKDFGIKHYQGIVVPESALTGMAKSYDMQRGPTGDGGSYYAYSFQDTWLGLCAVITFEGPYFGGGEPGELHYAYFYKLPGLDEEDPVGYGDIAKGAGLDPRTLPPRFTGSLLSIFDKLAERAEKDED
jgi:hypothetical protein